MTPNPLLGWGDEAQTFKVKVYLDKTGKIAQSMPDYEFNPATAKNFRIQHDPQGWSKSVDAYMREQLVSKPNPNQDQIPTFTLTDKGTLDLTNHPRLRRP